jgi:hypothetical protein
MSVNEVVEGKRVTFKGIFYFQLYFLTTWINSPFFEFIGAEIRLETFSFLLLIIFYLKNKSHIEMNLINKTSYKMFKALSILWVFSNVFSSLYFAITPRRSLWIFSQMLTGLLVLLILSKMRNKTILVDAANRSIFPLLVFYTFTYFIYIFGLNVFSNQISDTGRLTGFSFEANILGSQAAIWLGVLYQYRPQLVRWKNSTYVALIIVIISTGTRAAIFSVLTLFAFHLFSLIRNGRLYGIMFTIFFTSIILFFASTSLNLVFYAAFENNLGRVGQLFDLNSGTGNYRLQVYEIAVDEIRTSRGISKAFGNGTNSFSQFHPIDISKVEEGYLSNAWLASIYDTGFVGFTVFMLMGLSFYRATKAANFGSLSIWLPIIFCASTTNMLWFAYVWVSLGLVNLNSKEW